MSDPHGGMTCRVDGRRAAIRDARRDGVDVNGVDEVEVSDDGLTLTVAFFGPAPDDLGPQNVRVDGGRRVTGISVVGVTVEQAENPELDDRALVTLDRAGDGSRYRLSIVSADPYGRPGEAPYPGFDQRYFGADFRFWPQQPAPFDCAEPEHRTGDGGPEGPPLAGQTPAPVVDYTARDYEAIRRMLLDRLAVTLPQWAERDPADPAVALVELLAYTADLVSYEQDAVATEAYLDTARRRVSVRRHARLIDYPMHDGANARAIVVVDVADPVTLSPGTYRFAAPARGGAVPPGVIVDERELRDPVEVFEPVERHAIELRPAHGQIGFWTWGDAECVLRAGATSATLRDAWDEEAGGRRALRLNAGDLLVLEEIRGPRTGDPGDADPRARHAVRLESVTAGVDELAGVPVLEVTWGEDDALPWDLWLSSRTGTELAVARGNAILVDHGRSVTHGDGDPEWTDVPRDGKPGHGEPGCGCGCGEAGVDAEHRYGEPGHAAPPFQYALARRPVTQAVPYPDPRIVSAAQARRLAAIPELARRRLAELWRAAHDDTYEPTGDELAELAVLFGRRLLDRLGIRESPVRALRELSHRFDRLLAAKVERLELLASRARAGTVLDEHVADEIAWTWGEPYAAGLRPADPALHGPAGDLATDPRRALPAVEIRVAGEEHAVWTPRRDLLDSGPYDRHVVGELDDDGQLVLRFGDGRYGMPPPPGARLEIGYRVGGGAAGNVGAGGITHLLWYGGERPPVTGVRNPLPAVGGAEPEPIDDVRRLAPPAIKRDRLRAVTADDYAALATAVPGVRRAAAELRWTGAGYEVHVAVDAYRTGTPPVDLLETVAGVLRRRRRIGHDVLVEPARRVPLDIAIEVLPEPWSPRGDLLAELYHVLGRGARPADGAAPGPRLGFFHPDALTFGTPIRLSRLVAVAAGVPGVRAVRVTRLRRLFGPADDTALTSGLLRIGPLEIAQCDNAPGRPEDGLLSIDLLSSYGGA